MGSALQSDLASLLVGEVASHHGVSQRRIDHAEF